jgi:hypothetical protein
MKKQVIAYIVPDECPIDPINDISGAISQFALFHLKYRLGTNNLNPNLPLPKHNKTLLQDIEKAYGKLAMFKEVWLLDHSGISLYRDKKCQWDSSFLGYQFITLEAFNAEKGTNYTKLSQLTKDDKLTLEAWMDAEFDTYNAYVSGECYGYELYVVESEQTLDPIATEEPHGERLDANYGYYGYAEAREFALEVIPGYTEALAHREGKRLNEILKQGEIHLN